MYIIKLHCTGQSRPVARGGAHFLRQKEENEKMEKKETKSE